MTDIDAILAAIIADPAEDLHRLAYADALGELAWSLDGVQREFVEARAEFIRVQCEDANACHDVDENGDCPDGCRRCFLHDRMKDLFRVVSSQPIYNIPKMGKWSIPRYIFAPDLGQWERGFVATLRTEWSNWSAHHKAIRERQPIKRVVLDVIPGVEEKTMNSLVAPPGWAVGMSLGAGKSWCWESLGMPKIDPRDSRALTMCLLKAEWPGIEFVIPDEVPTAGVPLIDAVADELRRVVGDIPVYLT